MKRTESFHAKIQLVLRLKIFVMRKVDDTETGGRVNLKIGENNFAFLNSSIDRRID